MTRLVRFQWIILVLAGLALGGCASLPVSPQAKVLHAKNRVAPALVHIRPVKSVFSQGAKEEFLVNGSGFIISPDGYVVTNEHVAGQTSQVFCVLGNKDEVEAKVVGSDPMTDIALLKLQGERTYPYVHLGNSDKLESGLTVLALGSPHGLSRSVSMGIISVTDRYLPDMGELRAPYNTWIQTDAAINPGNSGGPLVNLRGEVVGVNARKLGSADNVGFAIPINIVKEVVASLKEKGRVPRSWLGLALQEMLAKTKDPGVHGVVVADVNPLSPASAAGLLPGDVLVAVNGVPVHARFEEDLPAVRKRIAGLPVGGEVTLAVMRGDARKEFTLKSEEQRDMRTVDTPFDQWGCTMTDLTPEMAQRAQLSKAAGLLVTGVQVGGMAHLAGLRQGDILLAMDGADLDNIAAFKTLYEMRITTKQDKVLFFVKRGALTRFVLLKQQAAAEGGENNATR